MPDENTGTDDTGTDEKTEPDDTGTGEGDAKGGDTGKEGKSGKAADDKADVGDKGRNAIDAMKRERNAALKRAAEAEKKNKDYEDRNKTESERLSEAAESARSRADKAEVSLRKMQTAFDRAPEHATPKQIRAVAKRISGDSEEEMEADADELFEMLAPAKSSEEERRKPAGKPRESLKGGGDPEDEPEESDPRKLAELIGRP